ncbi:MAG: hypothetical protein M0T75_05705 [Chloroflexi bacterium]|nr:hypothetical protein [Chloroflexota bacterium]
MTPSALEAVEVEALVTDRYLEALLAAADRRADDAPADPALDPAVRGAVLRLRDELVRVHPSFRFEERLARRLGEAAVSMRLAAAAGADAAVIPFPTGVPGPDRAPGDPFAGRPVDAARLAARRPLLVGGAVTSAALSLAGAAFVAWRLSRGAPVDPFARAVRLARAARGGRDALPGGLS